MSLRIYLMLLSILTLLTSSCAKDPISKTIPSECIKLSFKCLQGEAIVEITTSRGKIILEIDGNKAPITSGNFLDLVQRDVYKETIFHRVIRSPNPFVIQGGDPLSKYLSTPENSYGTGNFINPVNGNSRFIPLEIKLDMEEKPRYNQLLIDPDLLGKISLQHKKGSIAMARSQSLNTGSAQFYFALKQLPELDGRYAVFGRVIKGIDVLDKINLGDKIIDAKLIEIRN